MRNFSQSGSSSASSDVSTKKAVGRGFFSGNQMSSSAWNSPSPASGETTGQAPGPPQRGLPRPRHPRSSGRTEG